MSKFNIMESFQWMTPEFKIVDSGKHTIKIKGVALKGNVVSRNKRRYVDEELKRSARSWVGKPVTINHDMNRKVGHVVWMEYEKGALEYLADIKKEPYVGLLRDHSTKIRGVSIEAAYLHNQCPRCGEKFYSEEEFHDHMRKEHFELTDRTSEPHGIVGQALSLVLSPEEPGYTGSSVELMETVKPGLQLLETVIESKRIEEKMMKKLRKVAALTKESRQPYDKQREAKKLKEQEGFKQGEQPPAHPTEDGTTECEPGTHLDKETGQCVPDEVPEEHTTTPKPPATKSTTETVCADGFMIDPSDPESETCIPIPIKKEEPPTNAPQIVPEPVIPHDLVTAEQEDNVQPIQHPVEDGKVKCPEGTVWNPEINTCVPAEIPEEQTVVPPEMPTKTSIEITLPTKLRLGEPFSGYTDFADCVAKNQDKEDPEAYCATIKQKVEGDSVKETFNLRENFDSIYIRDVKLAETTNRLNEALAKLALYPPEIQKTLQKIAEKLTHYITAVQKQGVSETKLRAAYDRGTAKLINEKLGIMHTADVERTAYVNEKLGKLATAVSKNQKCVVETRKLATEQKADFEQILAVADKNAKEMKEHIKKLEERIKEQEAEPEPCPEGEHRNEEGECVPNVKTEEIKRIEEMAVRIENLEAARKGSFKGKSKLVKETQDEYLDDPLTTKKKGK